jgi:hypothetical protein
MTPHRSLIHIPRREFLKAGVGLTAFVAVGDLPSASVLQAAEPPTVGKSIGIQIGAASFADEGTEKLLDLLQEPGALDKTWMASSSSMSASGRC